MLYIHIPYCHGKCSYCAFRSIVPQKDIQPYVDALCRELQMRQGEASAPLKTVYFGGGTPSMLTHQQLKQILETICECYDLSQLEEATLECNPEDLTDDFLQQTKALGFFNRLSIGIQSFHDDDLQRLRRRHTSAEAIAALHAAYKAGFRNISIDLIYGLPNQNADRWQQNLDTIATIDPEHKFIRHLSCYALSIEPKTILAHQIDKGILSPASEESVLRQYEQLLAWCHLHGFEQYEISSFCQAGFRSRHNSRYWNRTPYLGLGAAAHGFDGCCRRWNTSDIDLYIAHAGDESGYYESEHLSKSDAFNEYVMTALRTTEGIAKALIPQDFAGHLRHGIQRFVAAGLIVETSTHYRPTNDGLLQADGMAADLFV